MRSGFYNTDHSGKLFSQKKQEPELDEEAFLQQAMEEAAKEKQAAGATQPPPPSALSKRGKRGKSQGTAAELAQKLRDRQHDERMAYRQECALIKQTARPEHWQADFTRLAKLMSKDKSEAAMEQAMEQARAQGQAAYQEHLIHKAATKHIMELEAVQKAAKVARLGRAELAPMHDKFKLQQRQSARRSRDCWENFELIKKLKRAAAECAERPGSLPLSMLRLWFQTARGRRLRLPYEALWHLCRPIEPKAEEPAGANPPPHQIGPCDLQPELGPCDLAEAAEAPAVLWKQLPASGVTSHGNQAPCAPNAPPEQRGSSQAASRLGQQKAPESREKHRTGSMRRQQREASDAMWKIMVDCEEETARLQMEENLQRMAADEQQRKMQAMLCVAGKMQRLRGRSSASTGASSRDDKPAEDKPTLYILLEGDDEQSETSEKSGKKVPKGRQAIGKGATGPVMLPLPEEASKEPLHDDHMKTVGGNGVKPNAGAPRAKTLGRRKGKGRKGGAANGPAEKVADDAVNAGDSGNAADYKPLGGPAESMSIQALQEIFDETATDPDSRHRRQRADAFVRGLGLSQTLEDSSDSDDLPQIRPCGRTNGFDSPLLTPSAEPSSPPQHSSRPHRFSEADLISLLENDPSVDLAKIIKARELLYHLILEEDEPAVMWEEGELELLTSFTDDEQHEDLQHEDIQSARADGTAENESRQQGSLDPLQLLEQHAAADGTTEIDPGLKHGSQSKQPLLQHVHERAFAEAPLDKQNGHAESNLIGEMNGQPPQGRPGAAVAVLRQIAQRHAQDRARKTDQSFRERAGDFQDLQDWQGPCFDEQLHAGRRMNGIAGNHQRDSTQQGLGLSAGRPASIEDGLEGLSWYDACEDQVQQDTLSALQPDERRPLAPAGPSAQVHPFLGAYPPKPSIGSFPVQDERHKHDVPADSSSAKWLSANAPLQHLVEKDHASGSQHEGHIAPLPRGGSSQAPGGPRLLKMTPLPTEKPAAGWHAWLSDPDAPLGHAASAREISNPLDSTAVPPIKAHEALAGGSIRANATKPALNRPHLKSHSIPPDAASAADSLGAARMGSEASYLAASKAHAGIGKPSRCERRLGGEENDPPCTISTAGVKSSQCGGSEDQLGGGASRARQRQHTACDMPTVLQGMQRMMQRVTQMGSPSVPEEQAADSVWSIMEELD